MREYFMMLLVSGVIGSIASVLSDGSSLGKYVKYISALICVIIVINPLSSILKSITVPLTAWKETVISESTIEASAIKMTEEQISQKIKQKFGIIPRTISIEIDRDGNICVSAVLEEEDAEFSHDVDEFIKSLMEEK